MDIYHYNTNTREYLKTSKARMDPLEDGAFLIPANATKEPVIEIPDGYVACFDEGEWSLVEDHRGESYYTSDGALVLIDYLGPIESGLSDAPPPLSWSDIRSERDALLRQCDWTQMPDSPLVGNQSWLIYRQALRDVTTQSDPDNINWPNAPI